MYDKGCKSRQFGLFIWPVSFLSFLVLSATGYLLDFLLSETTAAGFFLPFAVFAFWAALLSAAFGILLLLYELVVLQRQTSEKLDTVNELLSRGNSSLSQVVHTAKLSDTAKELIYRDTEQSDLEEAALSKLHRHEFDSARAMIAAMREHPKYRQVSERLGGIAEQYRNATEDGRVSQIIGHIESLIEKKMWAQASAHIDTLIRTFPNSEKAKAMPFQARAMMNRQKKDLLAKWDMAVQTKDTDLSLAILKELDLYLTPTEAMALRESASTVFKTKLHNLGMDFSVSVTEQNWDKAFETGKAIVQNFPNSRMAAEIRQKMDILSDLAKRK